MIKLIDKLSTDEIRKQIEEYRLEADTQYRSEMCSLLKTTAIAFIGIILILLFHLFCPNLTNEVRSCFVVMFSIAIGVFLVIRVPASIFYCFEKNKVLKLKYDDKTLDGLLNFTNDCQLFIKLTIENKIKLKEIDVNSIFRVVAIPMMLYLHCEEEGEFGTMEVITSIHLDKMIKLKDGQQSCFVINEKGENILYYSNDIECSNYP